MKEIGKYFSRWAEFVCIISGHLWNTYGDKKDQFGEIMEEYNECDRCGLEKHDRSGYIRKYKKDSDGLKENNNGRN